MLGEEKMMFVGGRMLLGWEVWRCVTTGHKVVPMPMGSPWE